MLLFLCGNYRNIATILASFFEAYRTIYECVEGVVATHTDVFTGVMHGASLTNDDVSCFAGFTTEYFHA